MPPQASCRPSRLVEATDRQKALHYGIKGIQRLWWHSQGLKHIYVAVYGYHNGFVQRNVSSGMVLLDYQKEPEEKLLP